MSDRLTKDDLQAISGAFGDIDLERPRGEHGPGFQVHRVRRGYRKRIPEWLLDREKFRRLIYSHPQWWKYAARWTAVAYWYWMNRCPASEIAVLLRMKTDAVKEVIKRLRRRPEMLFGTGQPRLR